MLMIEGAKNITHVAIGPWSDRRRVSLELLFDESFI